MSRLYNTNALKHHNYQQSPTSISTPQAIKTTTIRTPTPTTRSKTINKSNDAQAPHQSQSQPQPQSQQTQTPRYHNHTNTHTYKNKHTHTHTHTHKHIHTHTADPQYVICNAILRRKNSAKTSRKNNHRSKIRNERKQSPQKILNMNET